MKRRSSIVLELANYDTHFMMKLRRGTHNNDKKIVYEESKSEDLSDYEDMDAGECSKSTIVDAVLCTG